MKAVVRVALVLFTAAVLEQGVFSQLRIAGAAADVLLLAAIAAGLVGGADAGALGRLLRRADPRLDADPDPHGRGGPGLLPHRLRRRGHPGQRGAYLALARPRVLAAAGSVIGILVFVVVSVMVGRSGLWNRHLLVVAGRGRRGQRLLVGLAVRVLHWALGDGPRQRAGLR